MALAGALVAFVASGTWAHDQHEPHANWISSLRKPDYPLSSCCGPADQYYVREYKPSRTPGIAFDAVVIGHRGSPDFSIGVPWEKIIWDRANPTGRGVIFIVDYDVYSEVTCFVPGVGT
jgi:hypothetical protein